MQNKSSKQKSTLASEFDLEKKIKEKEEGGGVGGSQLFSIAFVKSTFHEAILQIPNQEIGCQVFLISTRFSHKVEKA